MFWKLCDKPEASNTAKRKEIEDEIREAQYKLEIAQSKLKELK